MRDIEFRGKNQCDGKWYYGYLVYVPADTSYKITQGKETSYFVQDTTIGQYTGFKDRNENKIFDGDVLKHTCQIDGEQIEQNYLVKFDDGAFKLFQRLDDHWSLDLLNGETLEFSHFIVIGNIYDNPELLEGDNVKD